MAYTSHWNETTIPMGTFGDVSATGITTTRPTTPAINHDHLVVAKSSMTEVLVHEDTGTSGREAWWATIKQILPQEPLPGGSRIHVVACWSLCLFRSVLFFVCMSSSPSNSLNLVVTLLLSSLHKGFILFSWVLILPYPPCSHLLSLVSCYRLSIFVIGFY